jgi:hypothetical protein
MRPVSTDVDHQNPHDADDSINMVELGEEDWRAWRVFLACRRAWRLIVGFGGVCYQGIEPTAVVANCQLLGIKRKYWPDVQWRLSVLESEALQFLNVSGD